MDDYRSAVKKTTDELDTAIAKRIEAGNAEVRRVLERIYEWIPQDQPDFVPVYDKEVPSDAPFFSETYLYNLLGKEDARTVLSLLGAIDRATTPTRY